MIVCLGRHLAQHGAPGRRCIRSACSAPASSRPHSSLSQVDGILHFRARFQTATMRRSAVGKPARETVRDSADAPSSGAAPARTRRRWQRRSVGQQCARSARATRATCCDNSAVRAGASPRQKGIVGGAPCASSTSTRPEFDFDPANAPRGVAQQHDVAGIALDREVLIHRADDDLFGLRHHGDTAQSPESRRRW